MATKTKSTKKSEKVKIVYRTRPAKRRRRSKKSLLDKLLSL